MIFILVAKTPQTSKMENFATVVNGSLQIVANACQGPVKNFDHFKNFEVLYLNNYTFSMPGFYVILHNFSECIFLYKSFWNLTKSIFTDRDFVHYVKYHFQKTPVHFEKWPKLPNFRLPKVLHCLRKLPVY